MPSTTLNQRGRDDLEERLGLRTELVAKFVDSYVGDFQGQELRAADRLLSGRSVTAAEFNRVVELFGTEAAVLLDRNGDALEVTPSDPSLIGTNLSHKYPHLQTATEGRAAVSNVVPSAVEGIPIVAFAVPFSTPAGRRVFSGAFDVTSTPLAAYVRRAAAVAPNHIYLLDSEGTSIASNDADRQGPSLPAPEDPASKNAFEVSGFHSPEGNYVTTAPVPGTTWRIALVAPESDLYAPIEGFQRWVPWLLWLGFAAGGLLSVALVGRLLDSRVELHRLARVDGLTALRNRTGIDEALHSELAAARRHGHDLAVLLIDVDDFKAFNDGYGHAVGDEILCLVAKCLRDEMRQEDSIGRWGGDEFLVVLPYTGAIGAEVIGQRLHERVARTPLVVTGVLVSTTISVGCATNTDKDDVAALVARADGALYEAKRGGRNQIATGGVPG